MIDLYQALIIFVVTILTALTVVVGIQVFFILREFREMLGRMTKILDDFETISSSVSEPIASFSEMISGANGVFSFFNWIMGKRKRKEDEIKEDEDE